MVVISGSQHTTDSEERGFTQVCLLVIQGKPLLIQGLRDLTYKISL